MLLGNFVQQPQGYKAFIPGQFPPKEMLVFSPTVHLTNDRATLALGKLDGIAQLIPDIDYFLSTYIQKEAAVSSNIEGTKATMHDALRADIGMTEYIPEDVENIFSYINAINHGVAAVQDSPLTLRIIRQVHEKMMKNTREGIGKTPGEIRKTQNWIGGTRPENALFVPPPAHELPRALSDIEKFLNLPQPYSPLIKAALLHAQFETVHPFLDGNGRTGRMLVTMFLWHRRLLEMPVLYLSTYFKKHQETYYEKLNAYHSENGNVEEWVEFFLDGVIDIANSSIETCRKITELRERDMRKAQKLGKATAPKTLDMIRFLYKMPTVGIADVVNQTRYSRPSAYKLIDRLVDMNILYPADENDGYGKKYTYKDYVEVFAEDESLG